MKCLKLEITQTSACYRKPETVDNSMTYPLPPFSTVIGSLHSACGWKEYHPMRVSIQGMFSYFGKRTYIRRVFYNYVQKDRGTFCKMCATDNISNAYTQIATPIYGDGIKRSLQTGEGFIVVRPDLLQEYLDLLDKSKIITKKIKELDPKQKDSIKELKSEKQLVNKKCLLFRSFERVPSSIELLHDVKLIIHVIPDNEKDLEVLLENYGYITSIGRSEDFVDVQMAEIVECGPAPIGALMQYPAYVQRRLLTHLSVKDGCDWQGTEYCLDRNYEIVKGQRVFDRGMYAYVRDLVVKSISDEILIDNDGNVFCLS